MHGQFFKPSKGCPAQSKLFSSEKIRSMVSYRLRVERQLIAVDGVKTPAGGKRNVWNGNHSPILKDKKENCRQNSMFIDVVYSLNSGLSGLLFFYFQKVLTCLSGDRYIIYKDHIPSIWSLRPSIS